MENLQGPGSTAQWGLWRRGRRGGRRGGVDCKAMGRAPVKHFAISFSWCLPPSPEDCSLPGSFIFFTSALPPLHTSSDYRFPRDTSLMSPTASLSFPEFQQLLSKLSAGPALFSYLQTIYLCGCFPVSLSMAPKYIINEIWKNKRKTCVNNYLIFPAIHCLIPLLLP